MHEKLNETARDIGLNDGLDLIVGSIGKVRNGPACIDQDLVVEGVDELGEDGKSGSNLEGGQLEVRLGRNGLKLTVFQSGCGVLPRQKLLRVQVALRSMLSLRLLPAASLFPEEAFSMSVMVLPRRLTRGCRAPHWRTKSLHCGLSPAMFPRAQTACSLTSGSGLSRSSTKIGTAPALMTTWVC